MTVAIQSVAKDELLRLVDRRDNEVREFINWAAAQECGGSSMYLENRLDIQAADKAASDYHPEGWWGVVVFTCFGCRKSTSAVRGILARPVDPDVAKRKLTSIEFARPKVGHHRIQQGLTGALKALVAACRRNGDVLHHLLHRPGNFDVRFQDLLNARLERWGRTTCFDLLVRTGSLGIGGHRYEPEIAYLDGSTGPSKGFQAVWGREVTRLTAPWCEGVLQAWYGHWREVVYRVGASWRDRDPPYKPGDLENALCIYQDRFATAPVCGGGARRC
jgi:hypothetical protein